MAFINRTATVTRYLCAATAVVTSRPRAPDGPKKRRRRWGFSSEKLARRTPTINGNGADAFDTPDRRTNYGKKLRTSSRKTRIRTMIIDYEERPAFSRAAETFRRRRNGETRNILRYRGYQPPRPPPPPPSLNARGVFSVPPIDPPVDD